VERTTFQAPPKRKINSNSNTGRIYDFELLRVRERERGREGGMRNCSFYKHFIEGDLDP
jgi:hypothetical protein